MNLGTILLIILILLWGQRLRKHTPDAGSERFRPLNSLVRFSLAALLKGVDCLSIKPQSDGAAGQGYTSSSAVLRLQQRSTHAMDTPEVAVLSRWGCAPFAIEDLSSRSKLGQH